MNKYTHVVRNKEIYLIDVIDNNVDLFKGLVKIITHIGWIAEGSKTFKVINYQNKLSSMLVIYKHV